LRRPSLSSLFPLAVLPPSCLPRLSLSPFDPSSALTLPPFPSLQTYVEAKPVSASSSDVDLRSKLVLLTISFPKLRIIWSSSPYQTVEIFRDLKVNRSEPDSAKAVLVGLEEGEGGVAAEGTAAGFAAGEAALNLAPQDILRSLPGVNSKNYRYLGSQVENLETLAGMDLGALQALVGNEPAKQLFGFIHSDHFQF
jgi:DNA excision repair protein ERCC-4